MYDINPSNGDARSITEVIGAVGGGDDLVTQVTYTSQGLVDTVIDPLGRLTDYDYDAHSRIISLVSAKGTPDQSVMRMEYDAVGNIIATVDANGNRMQFEYDPLNRLKRVIEADPDGPGDCLFQRCARQRCRVTRIPRFASRSSPTRYV